MPSALAAHLAGRFAADAQALRARAAALRTQPAREAAGRGGPDSAACIRMADACDRVRALFAEAAEEVPDDDALRGLLPRVGALVAGARNAEERNVFAGAVTRLGEGLDGGDDEDDEA